MNYSVSSVGSSLMLKCIIDYKMRNCTAAIYCNVCYLAIKRLPPVHAMLWNDLLTTTLMTLMLPIFLFPSGSTYPSFWHLRLRIGVPVKPLLLLLNLG
jgi:hypothetical protein